MSNVTVYKYICLLAFDVFFFLQEHMYSRILFQSFMKDLFHE